MFERQIVRVPFVKMHGCGNDFVMVDAAVTPMSFDADSARKILDRRFGVGGDQLLWLKATKEADIEMIIFNSDGGRAEMCGNGIRAVARWLREDRGVKKEALSVKTVAGIQTVSWISPEHIRVNMGKPLFREEMWGESVRLTEGSVKIYPLSMGNPHAVVFVENEADLEKLKAVGPRLERHELFPSRTNVEFVWVKGEKDLISRVWERGAGETLASGSGACAAGVVSIREGKVVSPVRVTFPGGTVEIEWSGGEVAMTGPASRVYEGVMDL